jgi:hypothetical protein
LGLFLSSPSSGVMVWLRREGGSFMTVMLMLFLPVAWNKCRWTPRWPQRTAPKLTPHFFTETEDGQTKSSDHRTEAVVHVVHPLKYMYPCVFQY